MTGGWERADEQWELVESILRPARREDNRGRPWHETLAVPSGVLWTISSGAQWSQMSDEYPLYQTCHRPYQHWIRDGKLFEARYFLARGAF
jgi:transposase